MKTFNQYLRERTDYSSLHDDAILIRLGDFIASLEDQISDKDRLLEIREDCPEPGTYALRLVPKVSE